MSRSIFTLPIHEVTFADVVAFCEQAIPEGVNLDYKREFPPGDRLAKTVSSFANTFGGTVLLGVDEDDQSRPALPTRGMPFATKLEERVWSILLENIYPPVMPEVQVCPPTAEHTFVLIRVPQSSTTPHAVRHNTSVYLRTGNITKSESLDRIATVAEIGWLHDRRKRSDELRAAVVNRTCERLAMLSRLRGLELRQSRIELSLGPKYPTNTLLPIHTLEEFRQTTRLQLDRYTEEIRTHEGLIRVYPSQGAVETFAETNVFGYTFVMDSLHPPNDKQRRTVELDAVLNAMADILRFSGRLMRKVGYWGICQLDVAVRGVGGTTMTPFLDRYSRNASVQLDDTLLFTYDIAALAWSDDAQLTQIIADVGGAVAWSFGWKVLPDDVAKYLSESDVWRISG